MELLAPRSLSVLPTTRRSSSGLTWLDTQVTIRIETSKVVLFRMTIVDPPQRELRPGRIGSG